MYSFLGESSCALPTFWAYAIGLDKLPVYRKGYIRWVMGQLTKDGRKRILRYIRIAKALKKRPPTPETDGIEEALAIDPALEDAVI